MNEQAVIPVGGPGGYPTKAPLVAGSRPNAIIPADIDQVWRLATIIHSSHAAPRGLDTKEKLTLAILHGLEIGMAPMMAIRRIAIINNTPSIWGDAVPALALSKGIVEDWEESIEGEGDAMVAICRVKRRGIPTWAEARFSVADAIKADLWDDRPKVKRKNKEGKVYDADNDSPWFRYPKRMLQMRARVAFRDLFADALSGLYIAEELIGKGSGQVDRPEPGEAGAGMSPQPPASPTPQGEELEIETSPDDPIVDDDELEREPPPPPPEIDGAPEIKQFDSGDIEGFLKYIETTLAKVTPADISKNSEALNDAWTVYIEPAMPKDIFPPDRDEAIGIFRKHELRLNP